MSRGLGRSLWRAPHTHVPLRGAALLRAGPAGGAVCHPLAVYVLDVGPWPYLSAASATRVAA